MVCVAGETSKKVLFPSDTPSLPGELPELKRKGGGGEGGGEEGGEEGGGEGGEEGGGVVADLISFCIYLC